MSVRRVVAMALLACAAISHGANAEEVEGLLDEATRAYAEGLEAESRDAQLDRFGRAELLFAEATRRARPTAALEINLGNAALMAEHMGPAVLAYRRALRLDPGSAQASQNLAHAREQLPPWVPVPEAGGALDSFFFWHRAVAPEDRALWAAAAFALASLVGAFAIVRRSSALRNLALLPLVVWAALVASLWFDPARTGAPEAVIVVQDTVARSADSANAPARFADPLPGGTEVTIVDDRGDWVQVALHNGRSAWVAGSSLERIDRQGD